MTYPYASPELVDLVQERMALGQYANEDELLIDAIHALNALEQQHKQLREEVQVRLKSVDAGEAVPLDMDALKAEAHRRFLSES